MEEQKQVDTFTMIIMEQRNMAVNEAAYWRAKFVELEQKIKEPPVNEVEKDAL